MPPYIYDTATRIILASQLWTASFDPMFAGSLMSLTKAGSSENVIYDHAGAAASIVLNSGNDPTLASATGISSNPLLQYRKPNNNPNVFVKETEYSDKGYAVEGSAPYFWISHEYFDDYVPEQNNRWQTLYNNIKPELAQFAYAWNAPVYFCPANNQLSGTMYVGNENASFRNTPSSVITNNFSLSSIIAFRFNPTSHDGNVASILATNNKQDALRFDINSTGKWAILEWGRVLISGQVAQSRVYNGITVQLLKRDNTLSIFFDNQPIASTSVYPGAMVREFAIQGRMINSIGLIEFSNRNFVDLDESFKVRYSVANDGALQIDAEAISLNPLFRTNLPQIFLSPHLIKRRVLVFKDGRRYYDREIENTFGDALVNLNEVAAVYTGNIEGTSGLLAYNFIEDCKNLAGQQYIGHLLIGDNVIGVNTMPKEANYTPMKVLKGSCKLSTRWLPYYDEQTIVNEIARLNGR